MDKQQQARQIADQSVKSIEADLDKARIMKDDAEFRRLLTLYTETWMAAYAAALLILEGTEE